MPRFRWFFYRTGPIFPIAVVFLLLRVSSFFWPVKMLYCTGDERAKAKKTHIRSSGQSFCARSSPGNPCQQRPTWFWVARLSENPIHLFHPSTSAMLSVIFMGDLAAPTHPTADGACSTASNATGRHGRKATGRGARNRFHPSDDFE